MITRRVVGLAVLLALCPGAASAADVITKGMRVRFRDVTPVWRSPQAREEGLRVAKQTRRSPSPT